MWIKNGLIDTVNGIFIVNAIAIPIFTVLDVMHLWGYWMFLYKTKDEKASGMY